MKMFNHESTRIDTNYSRNHGWHPPPREATARQAEDTEITKFLDTMNRISRIEERDFRDRR